LISPENCKIIDQELVQKINNVYIDI
jgi:hypothetical protein